MSNRHWEDISNEATRTYTLYCGTEIHIGAPVCVGIKRTYLKDGTYEDSHVVHDAAGNGWYIKDFAAIGWTPWEGGGANDQAFGDRVNEALQGSSE